MKGRAKFFYNGILLACVGLAMRGVQLVFGGYISRAVGAEGVGINTLIMTVYSFALTLAGAGVSLTVTRLTATALGEGRPGAIGRVLRGAFCYTLIFSLISSVGLLFLSGFLGRGVISDERAVLPLQILSLSIIPSALGGVVGGYFVGVRRPALNATVGVFGQALRIGFTVLLLTRFSELGIGYSLLALAVGITLSESICFLISLLQLFIDRRKARSCGGVELRGVASMALPLATSAYIRSALTTLEHSLIPVKLQQGGQSKSEALASYGGLHGMALPVILFPLTPLSSFSGLLVPEFAETHAGGDSRRLSALASAALNRTLQYALAVASFLYLFSEELGYIIYNSYDAGIYIATLAPIVPIMYLDHVTDNMLKGIGEHIYSMWVNIADACLSVILCVVLIPIMGIFGYAVVIIIMEGFNYIMSYRRLRRRISFSIDIFGSAALSLTAAWLSAKLCDALFLTAGSLATFSLLMIKIAFFACAYFVLYRLARMLFQALRTLLALRKKRNSL